MSIQTNGQAPSMDLPAILPQDKNEYTLIVSTESLPQMFFIQRGNCHWSFLDLNEAITFLAERKVEENPGATSFDILEPFTGFITDHDRARALEILQGYGKGLIAKYPVSFDTDQELMAALDSEFPGATWPADKITIASDPQMREYLQARGSVQLKNPNPAPFILKARQLKNAIYYELKYGNTMSHVSVSLDPAIKKLKPARKRKAA